MSEKKYYWLKLKESFFDEKQIKYLRKLPDGDKLIIVYLKMQLKSLRTEGLLKYDKILPSCEEELAMILDEDINIVKLTIGALIKTKAIEQLEDGSLYMLAMQDLIGKEGESTDRVRKFRERQEKRKKLDLQFVKKISNEQIALPDGNFRFIDNKRYGGNAEYVYDLAECKCEYCGESDGKKLLIHHNNGYSNDLEDLYLLCNKCHANVENGNIILTHHNRRSVTCNTDVTGCNVGVTKCNTEIEIEKEKEKEKDIQTDIYKDYGSKLYTQEQIEKAMFGERYM